MPNDIMSSQGIVPNQLTWNPVPGQPNSGQIMSGHAGKPIVGEIVPI